MILNSFCYQNIFDIFFIKSFYLKRKELLIKNKIKLTLKQPYVTSLRKKNEVLEV